MPAFIVEAVRTARGKGSKKGSLHHKTATELVVGLAAELSIRTKLTRVDDVILGCATQCDEQGANIARTAALLAGWGDDTPGVTVNRFCASGLEAVVQGARAIRCGEADVVVAGGVESISRVPMFSDRGPLWSDPTTMDAVGSIHMGVAADFVATIEGIGRDAIETYTLETHEKALRATEAGAFARTIVPITRTDGCTFDRDELIRARDDLAQKLPALPPAFAGLAKNEQGARLRKRHPDCPPLTHPHTAGTSPALADGACLVLLASEEAIRRFGWAPRARLIRATSVAVDPVTMLTSGQVAVEKLLGKADLRAKDISVFEFAEAFAALCLKFRRDLGAGRDRLNPNGGTIAMGHAFGATGAILAAQCVDELVERQDRYGVAAVSGAAGLGVAALFERCVPNSS